MNVDGISTTPSGLPARRSFSTAGRRPASTARNPGSGYLNDIRRFSILEKELEYRLAKRWREHGDRKAADQIVTSHLRLAAKIAKNYRGYGLPVSEIISEGNVGLMQAINRFDPDRGFRFATYAIWWIRASIQDYILRSWSLVKIGTTASQKKLFFKLRSAKAKISALDNTELRSDQVTAIATTLGVEDQDVVDMNRRLGGDLSLNASIRDEENSGEWLEQFVDESPSPEGAF
jgi:RNA polymerase sigma-32 factor